VPTDPRADDHRRRAAALRRLADRMDDTPLLTLHEWAGGDTWVSPRAEELRSQLSTDQTRVRSAAIDLRYQAWWLERQAEALDDAAAAAAAALGG
jgi:hypothetical protein